MLMESGCALEDPVILITQAVLDKWSGNVGSAREGLARALRLSEDVSDLVAVSRAACSLAILNCLDGKLGQAILQLRRALIASRASEHTRSEAICLNTVASSVGRVVGNHWWARNASDHAIRLLANGGGTKLAAFYRDSQVQLLLEEGRLREAGRLASEVLRPFESEKGSSLHAELLARKGRIELEMAQLSLARCDLEGARAVQQRAGERLQLVDTLSYLALAYARQGEAERALATSEEAIRLLTEIRFANLQPQRIFWHHYLILEQFKREPRVDYLRRAVELIEERGATLSRAQRRRFQRDVALNREILNAWDVHVGAKETARREEAAERDSVATGVPAGAAVGATPASPVSAAGVRAG
jgi:tetratricopeptide (TPR) repeat protein